MEYVIYTADIIFVEGYISFMKPVIFDTMQSCISYVTGEHADITVSSVTTESTHWAGRTEFSESIKCTLSKVYTHGN